MDLQQLLDGLGYRGAAYDLAHCDRRGLELRFTPAELRQLASEIQSAACGNAPHPTSESSKGELGETDGGTCVTSRERPAPTDARVTYVVRMTWPGGIETAHSGMAAPVTDVADVLEVLADELRAAASAAKNSEGV